MIKTYEKRIHGHTITLKYDDTRGVHVINLDGWYYRLAETGLEIEEIINEMEVAAKNKTLPKRKNKNSTLKIVRNNSEFKEGA